LSRWFNRVSRALPWRQTRDPYSIWISEIMLQQTQVITVIPYFEKFLARFPTVFALAASSEHDVFSLWSGLGYYSRARNLLKGAKHVVEKHHGVFPKTLEEVRAIPGIGPYTAGAILSIAFDLPVPLVDGNVQRVFSRYYAMGELLESKTAQAFFWEKAQAWVADAESPRVLNQALMECGATVCTKAQPRCEICPLKPGCRAFAQGNAADYPRRKPRRATEKLWWAALVHEHRGKILLQLNAGGKWWAGLWDFPRWEAETASDLEMRVRKAPRKRELAWQEHTVTHHRIHVSPFVLGWKGPARSRPSLKWVTPEQARQLPLTALAKKILGAYEGG